MVPLIAELARAWSKIPSLSNLNFPSFRTAQETRLARDGGSHYPGSDPRIVARRGKRPAGDRETESGRRSSMRLRTGAVDSLVVATMLLAGAMRSPADVEQLRREFAQPPDDARIMMRWWWFGPAVTRP